jgi:DNA-binding beta-propeller fold protein YncE
MRARVALLIVGLAAGCSTREHANPFDPANQVTSGRPAGFAAIAGDRRVDLRWDSTPATGLVGYQVFRRVGGSGEYTAITGQLEPYTIGYADTGLLNGVDHEYRLYFVFTRGLGDLPATDIATPGTIRPWVVDYSGGSLNALSPDGREVATRVGNFRGPIAVGVDTTRGLVWASEFDGGTVRVYNPATRVLLSIPGLRPGALAVQQADGTAWVCDELSRRVFHFQPDGQIAGNPIEFLTDPIGVAADGNDASVWVTRRC